MVSFVHAARIATFAEYDIGADEVAVGIGGSPANQAPMIQLPEDGIPDIVAFAVGSFEYQVVAVDPNDDPLLYELCQLTDDGSGGSIEPCTSGSLPGNMSIDSTGLITWAPVTLGRQQSPELSHHCHGYRPPDG